MEVETGETAFRSQHGEIGVDTADTAANGGSSGRGEQRAVGTASGIAKPR